jgi:kinesin family member 18/19
VELIEKGNAVRAEASNHLNQRSSRSHALLQIDIFSVQDQANPVTEAPVDANFMIIDLAGSEKSSPYLREDHQSLIKEGGNINRSLLALGNCITNLSNG